MSRRSRPHYRSGLGWILGVAFVDTLTRPYRLAQGFTLVRCCGALRASSPHGLAAPKAGVSRRHPLRAVALQLAVATNAPREGLSPPIQCPCQAHLLRSGYALPPSRPKCVSDQPRKPGRKPLISSAKLFKQTEPALSPRKRYG